MRGLASPGAVGAGRRHWKGKAQANAVDMPSPPKLLLHPAIGKACICVATTVEPGKFHRVLGCFVLC